MAALALSELGWFYVFMFIIFISFVYLAVLNVISGLFIQGSIEEAQNDIENLMEANRVEKDTFLRRLEAIFSAIDMSNGDDCLTLEIVSNYLLRPEMQSLLDAMG